MEDTRLRAAWHTVRSFFEEHQKLILVCGVLVVFIGIALLYFLQQNSQEQQQRARQGSAVGDNTVNPLVDPKELERVEQQQQQQDKTVGVSRAPGKKYKYKYTLEDDKRSFLPSFLGTADAATCNEATAPQQVQIYKVKARYTSDQAKQIAKQYAFKGEPVRQPAGDPSKFKEYGFFNNTPDGAIDGYFLLIEASGMYTYHKKYVIPQGSKPIGMPKAQVKVNEVLKDRKLEKDIEILEVDEAYENTGNAIYLFSYRKKYPPFPIVDNDALHLLSTAGSVCDIQPANTMGKINVQITQLGDLQTLDNKTRAFEQTLQATRADFATVFDDYQEEYVEAPWIKPVIFGDPGANAAGDIDITIKTSAEKQLVWFDFGEIVAQRAYIPMYLVSGTVKATGARVLTLFPAVRKADLDKLGILSGLSTSMQLDTYNPPPPPPPAITFPPGAPGGNVAHCGRGFVDYYVKCSVGGVHVCSTGMLPVPVAEGDPMKACDGSLSCKEDSGSFSVPVGEDPCMKFLERRGISNRSGSYQSTQWSRGHSGGQATCDVKACPC